MKILLNTPDMRLIGGVAAFCTTLKNNLKCDTDIFISGPRDKSNSKTNTLLRMLMDYVKYFIIMAGKQYDVVHINPSFRVRSLIRDAGFVLLAKCFRKKVVVFIHGWDMDLEQRLRQRWLWLFRWAYFHTDAFVVLANDFRKRLQSMGYAGPVYLGRTAIDNSLLSFFECNELSNYRSNGSFNILFLSRIVKEKGIIEALESYAILKSKNPNVKMTVAGDGKGLEEAKKLVTDQKIADVQFVGYVTGEDKAKVFRNADCYLFPSYEEGMPISVIEAMAFGLPVITRPVGALADFFENGIMGYLTESKSPELLADLVKKLIDDPVLCDKMSRYNRQYVSEHFSAAFVAAYIKTIYSDILNSNRVGIVTRQDL
ncbi:glycosyltransferase family 4 protein [Desulfobacterium sp. N47]|uniref:Glycosyl transferase family 1 domain-containing protein n=1 Tax=uncultured Desulfobacterium sp. TaxID=201089 RepID=E1YKM7_9BACT|nr:hypothetical protein N47_E41720 [uncultured Desulfobacterium sp.]